METCLKCKYRSECEEHYGKIGEEGEGRQLFTARIPLYK